MMKFFSVGLLTLVAHFLNREMLFMTLGYLDPRVVGEVRRLSDSGEP